MEQNRLATSLNISPAGELARKLGRLLATRALGALRLIAGTVLLGIGVLLGILGLLGIFGVARKVNYLIALSAFSLFSGVRLLVLGSLIVLTGRD